MHSYSFLKRLHFIILSFVILAPWGRLRLSQSISLDHGKYSGLRSSSWHLPSFPVVYYLDSLSRRRDRSGFAPDSNLKPVCTDYHEIMRLFFFFFSFYYVIFVIQLSRFSSVFIGFLRLFWWFFDISQFHLFPCWINTVVAPINQSGNRHEFISFCFDISYDLF